MEPQPTCAEVSPKTDSSTPRPTSTDLSLVVMAALAVGSAAILARWADAPALALAFWRCLGGAVVLAPAALRSSTRPSKTHWPLLLASGLALGFHFSTWLASLDHTSVAASVTLAATAPLFVAAWLWSRGERLGARTWSALALTLVGIAVITGGAVALGSGQAKGNGLALIGAVAMAAYLLIGSRLRTDLDTASYSAPTYAIAALGVLPVALASGTPLVGFDSRTWLAIVAMTIGPQLAGHTVLNALLPRLGSITVSLSLLTEPIGAAALAWLVFGEIPGLPVWLGSPLVIAGLALQTFGNRQTASKQTQSSTGAVKE